MTVTVSSAAQQAMADACTVLLDAGDGAGYMRIYDGTVPASVKTALTGQTQLAELTMSDPAFGAADSDGVATANAITKDSATDAAGTAAFWRAFDSDGTAILQGSCSVTGGGGDMQLAAVEVPVGVELQITSFTVTHPDGSA